MKVVNIQAVFPELKGGNAYQNGRGEGCNVKAATARAFADMYKRMKVRKTFTEFSVKVQVRDAAEETPSTEVACTST
jgi:hypothetical protein